MRNKTWAVLNESVVSRVATEFAKQFTNRLTKQGLGKLVPAASVAIGGTLNWATLEGIVDAADVAYRRRFLLEKYPHLKGGDAFGSSFAPGDIADDADVEFSVLHDLADAGGPELD